MRNVVSACNCDSHLKFDLKALALVAGGAVAGCLFGVFLMRKLARINFRVQLSSDKVVHTVDIEDIEDQKVCCRCWKSGKFPYCDGAHNIHNRLTGDNVGPLLIKKKETN